MANRSCVVVLIGEETANRPWVAYEIEKAWNDGKGLLGVYIQNFICPNTGKCNKGPDLFDQFSFNDGKKLSSLVKCYNPSRPDAYNDIKNNLEDWIEVAIAQMK
ncbi:TIR domain-containing protein [uncultured Desulfosarcina sp.]|uniref:TIR domain-containing protein n=1 Tax=uncultured Desulfosarcina sp. TaxID=218289 RepID=UPI003749A192